jgi:hypothetical protein
MAANVRPLPAPMLLSFPTINTTKPVMEGRCILS